MKPRRASFFNTHAFRPAALAARSTGLRMLARELHLTVAGRADPLGPAGDLTPEDVLGVEPVALDVLARIDIRSLPVSGAPFQLAEEEENDVRGLFVAHFQGECPLRLEHLASLVEVVAAHVPATEVRLGATRGSERRPPSARQPSVGRQAGRGCT